MISKSLVVHKYKDLRLSHQRKVSFWKKKACIISEVVNRVDNRVSRIDSVQPVRGELDELIAGL